MRSRAAIGLGGGAILVLVVVALALARGGSDTTAVPAAARTGPLTTKDGRIVDARGRRVLLRGFNVIPIWTDRPGATWGAGHYRAIRRAGLNTVRFMVHWDAIEPKEGRFSKQHLRTLDRAVRDARRAKLHVVLNMIGLYKGEHYVPAWAREGDAVAAVEQHGTGVVRVLARRYGGKKGVAAFDPVNEPPTYPPDQNRILRMYRRLIDVIREEAPGRLIMFEPSFGNSSMERADLKLLGDTAGLVFSIHDYYAGGAGAGYRPGGEVATPEDGARNAAIGGAGYDVPAPHELEAHLLVNLRVMRAAGIPVWVGEFGIAPWAPNASRWIRDKVRIFHKHGIGHAWWLYDPANAFTPIDPRTGRFLPFVRVLAGR